MYAIAHCTVHFPLQIESLRPVYSEQMMLPAYEVIY